MKAQEKRQLLFQCSRVFSPATPINTRDLFAGRTEQIRLVGAAVHTRGQHAIIFGERGVGKTSLANFLKALLADEETVVVKINCHQDDTFAKLWRSALSEIALLDEAHGMGFLPRKQSRSRSPAEYLDDKASPDDIRRILQYVGRSNDTVIIFDEFDRLPGSRVQRIFADTIKNLSDNAISATLVIVGVANDVSGLIKEHASVDRSLVQIKMPRMRPDELTEILGKAMEELGMVMEDEATELLILLSQGLPHYTHLLGQEATLTALADSRKTVTIADAKAGIQSALNKTQQSVLDAYQQATSAQRKGTLFREVLLACALAQVDEQGHFISAAVREPLSTIMKRSYDIPGFSQHLDKFCSDASRGPVLEKAGTSRRFRFRFTNPLLQPYVIMRGLADGLLEGELLELLRTKQAPT